MIDKLQAHYGFTRMPFGRVARLPLSGLRIL